MAALAIKARREADETSVGSVAAVESSVVAVAGEVVLGGDAGLCVEVGAGGCEGGAAGGGKSSTEASDGAASGGIFEAAE